MRSGVMSERVLDVWSTVPMAVEPARLLTVLDDAERLRAGSLARPQRARFVQSRALLRGVLAPRLETAPADVPLEVRCPACGGAHGPVSVASLGDGRGQPLHVSVTRSGPLLAVVVSRIGPVGLDVTSHSDVAAARLEDVVLSEQERAAYAALPWRARVPALARAWVRKEAVLKALRVGLRIDPALVDVRGGIAHVSGPGVSVGAPVQLCDLRLGPGVSGAVALAPSSMAQGSGTVGPGRLVAVQHDGARVLAALAAG